MAASLAMSTLNLPDTSIHYTHAGQGAPALVFVHGALCTHHDWRFQLPFFARQHAVLAPDLHGHGASMPTAGRIRVECFAADVLALCDALRLERIVLVGHSMGCRVLLQSWADQPQRIAGLVFVDGAYIVPRLRGTETAAERVVMAEAARARAAAAYRDVEPAERARHGFAQMFYDERFAALRDDIVTRAAALPGHVARELMPGFAAWDVLHLEDILPTITVPMLVIASTYMNDQRERVSLQAGVQTPWLQAIALHVPHAEVLRYHGWGHFPMLEQPEVVNREIARFLAAQGLHPKA